MNEQFKLNYGETKPFLTIEQQIELLKSRGLSIEDEDDSRNILARTNYYRLSGYSLTLRNNDKFIPGSSFDQLYEIYRFDDAFRKVILHYSANIEIAFRSYIAYAHAEKYGPLGYMDEANFEDANRHALFIQRLSEEVGRADDPFVRHHKFQKNCVFPVWAAIECSSFGDLSKMFKNLKKEDRASISKSKYSVPRKYVENWLQAIVIARNIAAHCGRFYNRRLKSAQIKLPPKLKTGIRADSAFAVVFAMHKLQPTKALSEAFREDLKTVINRYTHADKSQLGFADNWLEVLEQTETRYSYNQQI